MKAWHAKGLPVFKPGAPLYALVPLRFSGAPVAIGERVPERSARKMRDLWATRKASHNVPPRKVADAPGTDAAVKTFRVTPGESVHVETPRQRKRRNAE